MALEYTSESLKADSHIACRACAVPLPCRAVKGLECVFPIWFTQCDRVWFHTCHAMLRPCRSSQDHGTARPSRNGLWATCPRSASSGYHAEFHEGCYQTHTDLRCRWPVWNQKRLSRTRKRAVAAHYKIDDLLNCWTSTSVISGYHADFHEGHGTALARHAMCESAVRVWPSIG